MAEASGDQSGRAVLDYATTANLPSGPRWVRILVFVLTLPACVAPFVSFAWSTSPWEVIAELLPKLPGGGFPPRDDALFLMLSLPFLQGVLIVAWNTVRLVRPSASVAESLCAFTCAGGSCVLTLLVVSMLVREIVTSRSSVDAQVLIMIAVTTVTLLVSGPTAIHFARKQYANNLAIVFVLIAYLANSLMTLIGFWETHHPIGWWLTALASGGMLIQIILTFMYR